MRYQYYTKTDRKGNIIKVLNYNYNSYTPKDNVNPKTEGTIFKTITFNPRMRIPSKKHKNRYKNFLKIFPSYKEK